MQPNTITHCKFKTSSRRSPKADLHLSPEKKAERSSRCSPRSIDRKPNGNAQVVLNFLTPHQKWGIHSTYTDNLLMLTLSRGGPIVWISEIDAKAAGIVDNDWIEAYNTNGALVARAVVSQRVKQGLCMM